MADVHTLLSAVAANQVNPLLGGLMTDKIEAFPELSWAAARILPRGVTKYKTLWDVDPLNLITYQGDGKTRDFTNLGGFRPLNGWATSMTPPTYEPKEVETFIMNAIVDMDPAVLGEFPQNNDVTAATGLTYEQSVLRKELRRIFYTHSAMFWHGTNVDPLGYKGVYQTYQLAFHAGAMDDVENTGGDADAGNHASIWLLRTSDIEEDGLGFVFSDGSLASLAFDEWRTDLQSGTDPNSGLAAQRSRLWNEILHRPGFQNLSKWNAIRVYGITDPAYAGANPNPCTDEMAYDVKASLPVGSELNYTAWMNPKTQENLRKQRQAGGGVVRVLNSDGAPVEEPMRWGPYEVRLTDQLGFNEA